jgi:hypothetical protein
LDIGTSVPTMLLASVVAETGNAVGRQARYGREGVHARGASTTWNLVSGYRGGSTSAQSLAMHSTGVMS